jgi:hypothetical protein
MALTLLDFANQTQVPLKRGIVQEITNESVFLRRLRFVSVDGFAYSYNRQQTLGGIAFRGLNESYTNDTGVVNPQVETLSIFGGEVRTDRQLVNKQGDVVRANAIAAKVKKAGLFFDRYVIRGDPGADPLQFYGLNSRLAGGQVLDTGANGGPLTLDKLDQALDAVPGSNDRKFIVCNKRVRRKITELIRTASGSALMSEVGPQVSAYDGAPIEVLDEDGDESPILPFTEVQGSSGASTTSLYVVRPGSEADGSYVQGLIGAKLIEHVAVGLLGTYYSDIVEANMGLGMFHSRAACRVKGITNA